MEDVKLFQVIVQMSKTDLIEYRRKENTRKNNQEFQLQKEKYDKLVDFTPSVSSHVETI